MTKTIISGIIAGILTYIILYYKSSYDENNNKKNPSLKLPLIVGLLTWFVYGKIIDGGNFNLLLNNNKDLDKSVDIMNDLLYDGSMLNNESIIVEMADF